MATLAIVLVSCTCARADGPAADSPAPGAAVKASVLPADPAPATASTPLAAAPGDSATAAAPTPSAAELPDDPGARLTAAPLAAISTANPAESSSRDSFSGLNLASGAAVSTPQAPGTPGQGPSQPRAPVLMKYIPPGYTVQEPLTAHQKFLLGVRDLYNPLNFAGMFASAGYEQLFNNAPNYGVDRGAFGERLGAAAIRESTQGFFSDSIFAPLFHDDPRYYIEGRQHTFLHRTVYAVTRTLVTRTDSGRETINAPLLVGYAASAGVSYAYYPPFNQNFRDTAGTFAGGVGGAALGFFVSEFSGDVLRILHINHPRALY